MTSRGSDEKYRWLYKMRARKAPELGHVYYALVHLQRLIMQAGIARSGSGEYVVACCEYQTLVWRSSDPVNKVDEPAILVFSQRCLLKSARPEKVIIVKHLLLIWIPDSIGFFNILAHGDSVPSSCRMLVQDH